MAKPKFDPNAPYEAAPENKPKFDASKPFEPLEENYLNLDQPNMLQRAGGLILSGLRTAGRTYDSYLTSPTRAAIGAVQDGKNPLIAGYDQFGSPPEEAPSGKEIAAKGGASTVAPILSAKAQEEHDKLYAPNQYQMRMANGGYKDQAFPSKAGLLGFAIDVVPDPANLLAVAPAVKGAFRLGGEALGAVGRGAQAANEALGVTRGIGKAVNSTTIGTVATDTAKTIKSAIDGMFHPKQAEDFSHWVDVAARNEIDPSILPESVEFGEGSSISRIARSVRENPLVGEPDMKRFHNGLLQVSQAVKDRVHEVIGGVPLNDVEAGNLLREGHDRAVDDLFKRTDLTYKNVVQQAPNMSVTPKSIQSINEKFKEIGDYALKESTQGPIKEGRTQAKNLMEDLQAIRGRMSAVDPKTGTFGSMAQLQETMSSVGKYAFQKGKIGEIAADREKLKDLYFTLRDAFINSTAEQLGPEVAQSLIDTNQQITMFNKDIEPISKMLKNKDVSPEKLFRTLVVRGDTKQLSALKDMLTPEEFNQLRGSYLDRFITTRDSDGAVDFRALRSKLQQNTTTLSTLFEPQEIENIIELSKLGEKWGPPVLSTSGTGASNLLRDSIEGFKSGATGRATVDLMKEKARAQALGAAKSVPQALQASPESLGPVERFMQYRQRGPGEEAFKATQILGAQQTSEARDRKTAIQRKLQGR